MGQKRFMNMQPDPNLFREAQRQRWIPATFCGKGRGKRAVVRRSEVSVRRELGAKLLEFEVKKRGFHMVRCGGQFIIICNPGQLQVVC